VFHVERDRPSPDGPPDAPAVLAAGLAELALPADLVPPLATLATLLAQWAARMNLTGHRTSEAIARRLILDALALGSALPDAGEPGGRGPASLADLGSGAGFPGLPLAIRWPGCHVTLVEARERRHHFQRAAVRTLGLVNVEPRRGRIEALAPEPHEIVVAQALAQPDQAVAWMLPWVAPGGWLVLPRTADAPGLPPVPGLEDAQLRSYQVPLAGPPRALWMARRPRGALDAPSAPVVRTRRPPD
jgi:16S rRNA (guanine527-N7)-methyltransferase